MTVALRDFAEQDIPFLFRAVDSADALLQWAGPGFRWPLDEEQLREYLERSREPDVLAWSAVADAAVVGHVQLVVDRAHEVGYVGRVLVDAAQRGRGIGTTVMREVVRRGFDELRLHRLALNVFDFNEAAVRCYERVGFRREGHLRDARKAAGGYWSLYVMGMLAGDPRG